MSLVLIQPDTLIRAIQLIERVCPGWWWSISQKKDEVFINMGPGRNGPHLPDLIYALTKEGDSGRNTTILRDDSSLRVDNPCVRDIPVEEALNKLLLSFNPNREIFNLNLLKPFNNTHEFTHRFQSPQDLTSLHNVYNDFVVIYLPAFQTMDYVVEQIYLGSCDTSADCSLRGKDPEGNEFDITIDLKSRDENIAGALKYSIDELKSEILTPGN